MVAEELIREYPQIDLSKITDISNQNGNLFMGNDPGFKGVSYYELRIVIAILILFGIKGMFNDKKKRTFKKFILKQ